MKLQNFLEGARMERTAGKLLGERSVGAAPLWLVSAESRKGLAFLRS